jgi:hypothetical protein
MVGKKISQRQAKEVRIKKRRRRMTPIRKVKGALDVYKSGAGSPQYCIFFESAITDSDRIANIFILYFTKLTNRISLADSS